MVPIAPLHPVQTYLASSDPYLKCMGVAIKCGTLEVKVLNVDIHIPLKSCAPYYSYRGFREIIKVEISHLNI